MKLITVLTPCLNEEENVREVYAQVKAVFAELPQYRYEHLFIDNASTDRTVAILKEIAAAASGLSVRPPAAGASLGDSLMVGVCLADPCPIL
jgi:glycosyltransferase involved in cell wall biosynthesis